MKRNSFTSITLSLSMLLFGCSTGNGASIHNSISVSNGKESDATVKKKIYLGNFNKISAQQGIKIVYSQGKNPGYADIAVTPSASDYIKVYVEDGCLKAKYEGKFTRITGPSIVHVSSPQLTEIEMSSAASLVVSSPISQKQGIDINLSSAAGVDFKRVECPYINFEMSSSSNVSIGYTTANLDMECSSASSVNIGEVRCAKADIELSSAASATIKKIANANIDLEVSSAAKANIHMADCKTVDVEASSHGNVKLSGSCRSLDKETSSGGSITVGNTGSNFSYSSSTSSSCTETAITNRKIAETNRKKAEANKIKAETNRKKAEANRQIAKANRQIAEANRQKAKAKRKKAEANRKKTEENTGECNLRIP
ncbi:MAG: DUF2807 domain-containing protein [Muribaculaceae bacterium]|nr:DUF2807 domain-containing protein [Muribaculaceae bacterium]